MKKSLLLSILVLCISSISLFGQDEEIIYKRNAFGLDFGSGGTTYNHNWWGEDTGPAYTFDFGFRYLHNFSPYWGIDFFKFKSAIGFKNEDDVNYFAYNGQLMTGARGYSPTFTKNGMRGFSAFRMGGGFLANTFTDFDYTISGLGGGFCYEFEIGLYITRTFFLAFAYNHQGGSITFENDYKTDIKASHPAFRIGFDFGRTGTHSRREGSGGRKGAGAGAGSGSGSSGTSQSESEFKPVTVKKEQQEPCYTIEEMKEFIRDKREIRGKKICAIKQVNFEFGKSTLTKSDKFYLDEIVNLMKQNNEIHIKINGHTDNVGTEEFNINLSRDRARSVYDYLISEGIAASRLSYEYFGTRRPIADNDTDGGRAVNRRVEFEIINR